MTRTWPFLVSVVLILAAVSVGAPRATAQLWPSDHLLVPYFDVDLSGLGTNTLFAVSNPAETSIVLTISVHTNWGLPVVEIDVPLDPEAVHVASLQDWLVNGRLPGRTMGAEELAHIQAALSGQASPKDNLYYSTEVVPGHAIGYVLVGGSADRVDLLWGDTFLVDSPSDAARGDMLVDLSIESGCSDCQTTCYDHGFRFLQGGAFDGGTKIVVWTNKQVGPLATPFYPDVERVRLEAECHNQRGVHLGHDTLWLLPLELFDLRELDLPEPFGWIRLTSEERTYVGLHLSADNRFSIALETTCLPRRQTRGQGLVIEKSTNSMDADFPPGIAVSRGGGIEWTYEVTNVGHAPLSDVEVTDDQGVSVTCPQEALERGESMVCIANGYAVAECRYGNVGTATGITPSGITLEDRDPSHYYIYERGRIDLEKYINGEDADWPVGPVVDTHDPVEFAFHVTNTGEVILSDIYVVDDVLGAVCQRAQLVPGESMTCEVIGEAGPKQHRNVGTATGKTPCRVDVSDRDPGHYYGWWPDVTIEKATNGHDADTGPGPQIVVGQAVTWTYVVTNTGDEALVNVVVSDSQSVAVSCPKSELAMGESMTCTARGVAVVGQYANLGTVVADVVSPALPGAQVTDSDPSHYFGYVQEFPGISIEKATNGLDADLPKGPEIAVGGNVQWSYVVTNSGNVVLSTVSVTDDQGVAVSCPKSSLAVGESMTCTASGAAIKGQYANVGTVTAKSPNNQTVTDADPSHYYGYDPEDPGIRVEKATNGHDADSPTGPELTIGGTVQWTYVVTNTGNVALSNVTVTDDQGAAVSCPKSTLAVGKSMTCTASGTAIEGQYANIGTVTGTSPGGKTVNDTDPSHYFGSCGDPGIVLTKYVGRNDGAWFHEGSCENEPDLEGQPVWWKFVVTNTGNVTLDNVVIQDGGFSCTIPSLAPGATWGQNDECLRHEGGTPFSISPRCHCRCNTAEVTADRVCDQAVYDSDKSCAYF